MDTTRALRRMRTADDGKVPGPSVACACGALVPLELASHFQTMTLIPCPDCGLVQRHELADRDAVA